MSHYQEFDEENTMVNIELDKPSETPSNIENVRHIANTFSKYLSEGMEKLDIVDTLQKKGYELNDISAGYDLFIRSA